MASDRQRPTAKMREEWSQLPKETRESILSVMAPAERSVVDHLDELGVSSELRDWIVTSMLRRLVDNERRVIERVLEVESDGKTTPYDRFNHFILSLIFLVCLLIWFTQDVEVLVGGTFPIALPVSTFLLIIGTGVTIQSFRKWMRSLKEKTSGEKGSERIPGGPDSGQ